MKFSVVIPAFNEADFIENTIKAVQAQAVDQEELEIIVVDNNCSDNTAEIVLKNEAILIKETNQGTNFARQRGYTESNGEIVVFLDADSEPFSDWLKKIEEHLSKEGIAAVSGPFDYGFKGFVGIISDFYTNKVFPKLPHVLYFVFRKKAGVIIGGNFAVKRETVEKIGGLPPLEFWGDDAAIAMLISRRDGKVIFTNDLKVKSSARRFIKVGLLKLTFKYAKAYFGAYFSKDFQ